MKKLLFALLFLAATNSWATTPAITSFTASTSSVVKGGSVVLTWTASNTPTSISITPDKSGSGGGTYTNSSTPASGNDTFVLPTTGYISAYGDSIACGFRLSNSAQNTFMSNLPCSPNPNPNGAPTAMIEQSYVRLLQSGVWVSGWNNFAVTGATISTNTGTFPTCNLSTHNPWIVFENYGSNDFAAGGTAATMAANKKTWWDGAKASGCTVVAGTVTPRNASTDSIRTTLNSTVITNAAGDGVSVIDIGSTSDQMGCVGCNNTDTTDYNADNLHFTQAGVNHWTDIGLPTLQSLMKVTYTITATNASGTSAPVTVQVQVLAPDAGRVQGNIQ